MKKKLQRRLVIITGVPGTGKTAIATLLAKKMKAKLIALNDLVSEFGLYTAVDEKDGAKIVRMGALENVANEAIELELEKKDVVVEGHLACELDLGGKAVGDVKRIALVCRVHPDELKKRLAKRKYPKEKLGENTMAEMLDYCTVWAEKKYGRKHVLELDTTKKTAAKSAEEALALVLGKKKAGPRVDWGEALFASVSP